MLPVSTYRPSAGSRSSLARLSDVATSFLSSAGSLRKPGTVGGIQPGGRLSSPEPTPALGQAPPAWTGKAAGRGEARDRFSRCTLRATARPRAGLPVHPVADEQLSRSDAVTLEGDASCVAACHHAQCAARHSFQWAWPAARALLRGRPDSQWSRSTVVGLQAAALKPRINPDGGLGPQSDLRWRAARRLRGGSGPNPVQPAPRACASETG